MTPDDDDARWLAEREAGRPVPADRADRAAVYDGVGALLRALPDEPAPPAGWQARVLAELGAADAVRPPRRRRAYVAVAAAAVAVAAGLALWLGRSSPPSPPLVVEVRAGEGVRRATGAALIGDELVVESSVPGAELRIYRDDRELVLRCPGTPPCRVDGDTLTGTYRLSAPGTYRAVLLRDASAPAPTGSLDQDLAKVAAEAVVLAVPIEVR